MNKIYSFFAKHFSKDKKNKNLEKIENEIKRFDYNYLYSDLINAGNKENTEEEEVEEFFKNKDEGK